MSEESHSESSEKPKVNTKKSGISRRAFIAGTVGGVVVGAVAGAAVGSIGFPTIPASVSQPWLPAKWDQQADVVVVGSGGAGYAAAITAADNGASVILLEKEPWIGGNSRASGGNYGSYGDPLQLSMASTLKPGQYDWYTGDSADLYYFEKGRLGDWQQNLDVLRVFVDNAPDNYAWMQSLGVKWGSVTPYSSCTPILQPQNTAGMYFHGFLNTPYTNGSWIGPFTKARWHTLGAYKTFDHGEANIMALADAAAARGSKITTLLQMQVTSIIRSGGPLSGDVLGVYVTDLTKNQNLAFRANKAVVLAAGGWTANAALCNRYDPRIPLTIRSTGTSVPGYQKNGTLPGEQATDTPGAGCTGEMMLAAMDLGADCKNLDCTQLSMDVNSIALSGPKAITLTTAVGKYIDVDGNGNRFWQEGFNCQTYPGRLTYLFENKVTTTKGEHTWWGITDSGVPTSDTVTAALAAGATYQGDTLQDLAGTIGVPPANLVATVTRYNSLVDQGEDTDFGQLKQYLTYKLTKPPFFAFSKTYYRHHSEGGITINTSAQVVDRHAQVIPRLYAAGEITGTTQGIQRDGGCGWNDIITFGRIAGKNAAAETPST